MRQNALIADHIKNWLSDYCEQAGATGFIIGISGGIDSAVTSTLCALTGKKVLAVTMPIRQTKAEFDRANEHIAWLKQQYPNVSSQTVDLTDVFESMEGALGKESVENHLAMANTRAR